MKKLLIVIFLFCLASITVSQSASIPDRIDSLTTGRTSVKIRWNYSFQYPLITFSTIATGDSVRIYNMTDSLHLKHNRDTIACELKNYSTFALYTNGLVTGLTSPSGTNTGTTAVMVENKSIKYIYMRLLDASDALPTIYFRVNGINY